MSRLPWLVLSPLLAFLFVTPTPNPAYASTGTVEVDGEELLPPGLVVRPGPCYDQARSVYGTDLPLDVTATEFRDERGREVIDRLLRQSTDYGWAYALSGDLVFSSHRQNDRGKEHFRYQQYYRGHRILGGELIVTTMNGKVTAIRSALVPLDGLDEDEPSDRTPEEGQALSEVFPKTWRNAGATVLRVEETVVHVDKGTCARRGTLAHIVVALCEADSEGESVQRLLLAADTGKVLEKRATRLFSPDFVMQTEVYPAAYADGALPCTVDADCTDAGSICFYGSCIFECPNATYPCGDHGTGWACRTDPNQGWEGLCWNDDEAPIFDGTSWTDARHASFPLFKNALDHTVAVHDTIQNVMGRAGGWSGDPVDPDDYVVRYQLLCPVAGPRISS